jgi:hypothetical protein
MKVNNNCLVAYSTSYTRILPGTSSFSDKKIVVLVGFPVLELHL